MPERVFDRLPEFDPRSRNYGIRDVLKAVRIRSRSWGCRAFLDQGSEGACVGFAVTHEAAASPKPWPVTNPLAFAVYKEAQQLDPWPGDSYQGTSVLAGMKAGVNRGMWGGYRWAFSLDELLAGISQEGPAILGLNWYEGMMRPDDRGRIQPTGEIVGGHAILARGAAGIREHVRLRNSWGSNWGLGGDCLISFADLERLLNEDGEAAIPVDRRRPSRA